jgi:hypothetical protein
MEDFTPVSRLKVLYQQGKLPLTVRGKLFGLTELRIIHQCIFNYKQEGRTRISQAVCEALNWRQPNGWLKDRACRDVLQYLEKAGLIELPPALVKRKLSYRRTKSEKMLSGYDLTSPVTEMPEEISLDFAKGDRSENVWNELVDKYHYLGYKVAVGRCIKYLIRSGDILLGAISFSSPAWKLQSRDRLLQEVGIEIDKFHNVMINNSRFLILPNVRVDHLASRVLSIATARVIDDWLFYYSIRPEIAETFVQPSKFDGTCYRAANWIEIGQTKGYAKQGRFHHNSQEPKQIFLYGLSRRMRRQLSSWAKSQSG